MPNRTGKIAFQGELGANSDTACRNVYPNMEPVPCPTFEDAFDALKSGDTDLAMIPIENSQAGRVAHIHFLLPESGLSIVGEHFLRIRHALMAIRGATGPFQAPYSHPHALAQSRHFLRERGMVSLSFADTEGASAYVSQMGDPSVAAISPTLATDLYCLDIVEESVEDAQDNTTRFVILAREALDPAQLAGQEAMTTFVFEVKNIPAALYKALGGFATNGVNMTKLESYLRDGRFSAAEFYMDIEGAPEDPGVALAMEELRFHSKWVRLLGTYPRGRDRV